MKQLAVGLIALLAGAELRVRDLVERYRTIAWILALQTAAVLVGLTALVLLLRTWIPFLEHLEFPALLFVALLFAATLTVNSPMVTLALLTETRAEGPLAKTTLGVVLVADVVVVLVFTAAFSLAQASLGGATASAPETLVRLLREVVGSMLAGALIGGVLTLYLRFVRRELVVFVIVLVFATAAAAQALHFELLLSLLVAGFLVENVAPVRAEPLVEMLHVMAVPGLRDLLRHGGSRSPAPDLRGSLAASSWRWRWPGWDWSTPAAGPAPGWVRRSRWWRGMPGPVW